MVATKPYEFIGLGAMEVTKPYKFIGFGAMEVTKPYICLGFGAMDVTIPYKFIGFGAMESFAPTFPDGFPGGRRPFRPPKSTNLGFYLSAPFGAAPFYGSPTYVRPIQRPFCVDPPLAHQNLSLNVPTLWLAK